MRVYAVWSICHSPRLQLLLSPGDRILMSPLEDDTVFFGALAAGLRPVMAPVSTYDGNMRIDAIDDVTPQPRRWYDVASSREPANG
jgi:hypothetical protein